VENQGIVRTTLQAMLMSSDNPGAGRGIYLLPAWPQGRDVSFRLHAPHGTVVECQYAAGCLAKLTVTPTARRVDLVLPLWLRAC